MPNYDYICKACNVNIEANLPSVDRDSPGICPFCGEDTLVRQLAAPKHIGEKMKGRWNGTHDG